MSARTSAHVTSLLAFLAAVAMPIAAQEATVPQTAAPAAGAQKPVDEAAAAMAESLAVHSDGVAAIVNDVPISNYDVRQRVSLYMSTSGVRSTPEAVKQIRPQILKQLETERLELIEAEKNKVSVSTAEVDKEIADILKDNHMTGEQLNKVLSGAGVRMETLRAQIAANIAWSKLVQNELGDRVHVSSLDVDDELARLKRGADQPHYEVSEIFQAVDTPEQEAKVHKDMDDLETQLQQGAPFSAVARQLSQNPTAAQGGDLGIVQPGQLPPELEKALMSLHAGQTSPPIRATGGYYILLLREILLPEGAKDPTPAPVPTGPAGTLPLWRVTLPIGSKPPKDLIERAMRAAAMMRSQIQTCANVKEVAAHLPGSVPTDMGNFKLADLSQEMQDAIQQADPGGTTAPLMSPVGVEVFVRCDKPIPRTGRYSVPPKSRIEEQLYEEQISTLGRQYLRDLRRDADIETVEKD